MNLMVIDIGGTEVKYSVMDESLARRDSGSIPTPRERQEDLFAAIRSVYAPHKREVEGIAVSMPGFIDTKKGRCNGGGALRYNRGTSIAPELARICGCPVHIANDGKCAAYAELMSGALVGTRNSCVYIIGTGVGGGLIINGEILNGIHFTAGEYSFLHCGFEPWDSAENMVGGRCSTTGLLAAYRKNAGLPADAPMNGKIFFGRVAEGEAAAVRTLDTFASDVAKSIVNIAILLDIEKAAIGGGISRQPVLIEKIRASLEALKGRPASYADPALIMPEVVPCKYLSDANMVGAYLYYKKEMV